jgi:hypothetical protein
MVVVPPFTGAERQLAQRNDRVVVVAKMLFPSLTVTSGTVSTITIQPAGLGFRALQFSKLYSRYRILKSMWEPVFVNASATATTPIVYGIQDDVSGEGGAPTPTTLDDVYALRCSIVTSASGSSVSGDSILYWKPMDVEKYYYTSGSSSDARLSTPGTLCVTAGTSITGVQFRCFYTIEFSGAIEVSGN